MLSFLRNKSQHWSIIAIVVVGIIGMIFFFGSNMRDKGDYWVAKIGDETIRLDVFLRRYQMTQERLLEQIGKENAEYLKTFNLKSKVLSDMINERLFLIEAKKNNIKVLDAEVREAIRGIPELQKDGVFSLDYYRSALNHNRMAPVDFEKIIREEIMVSRLRNLILSSVKFTEDQILDAYKLELDKLSLDYIKLDIKKDEITKEDINSFIANSSNFDKIQKYYSSNSSSFKEEERVKARHILIKTDLNNIEEKRAQIEEIKTKLNKDNFSEMAKKYSQDEGSAIKGGDLGYFEKGRMVKEFENVAFSMKKDEISKVFKTEYGFHIIYLEDKIPEKIVQLNDVKEDIANILLQEEKANNYKQYIANKVSKASSITEFGIPKNTGFFSRSEDKIPGIELSVASDVLWSFNLDKNRIYVKEFLDDVYIFSIKAMESPKVDITSPKYIDFKDKFLNSYKEKIFYSYFENIRKKWDPKIKYSKAFMNFLESD